MNKDIQSATGAAGSARAKWSSSRLCQRLAYSSGICGLVLFAPHLALAQTANAPGAPKTAAAETTLTDVIVTAQRHEERLMSVPIAVSAVSGKQLAVLGITKTEDIVKAIPGVTMNEGGPNQSFSVRGVSLNDAGDSNESPVALYEDDVYVAALAGAQSQMFDVGRVEVLRGPQGTLFGRNATGGVVQVISNKPTDTFSGDLSFQYGSYNQTLVTGAVSGPLFSDKVRGRLAFSYDHDDGWQKNVVTDTRTAKADNGGVRGLLDADVTSKLKVEFNAHIGGARDIHALYGSEGGYNAASGTFNSSTFVATGSYCTQAQISALAKQCTNYFGFRDPNPNPKTAYSTLAQPLDQIHNWGSSVEISYDGGWFDLKSISAYEFTKKYYEEDADPSPVADYIDPWGATRAQISEELRASGDYGPMHWTTGIYFFTEHITHGSFIGGTNLVPIYGTEGVSNYFRELTDAGAGYTQVDYNITPTLTVTGGVRYSQEYKTLNITDSVEAPSYHETDTSGSNAVTWKGAVNWKFMPDWLSYASVATGFKSPGFNTTGVGPGGSVASQPEHIITYEVGAKGSMWDRRLQFTSALYYSRYSDQQVVDGTAVDGYFISRLINIPLSKIYGVELGANANPIDHVYMELNGTWTHSRVIAPGLYDGGALLDGSPVTNTPEYTLKGSAEYRLKTQAHGDFTPRIAFNYQTGFLPEPVCSLDTSCRVPGYVLTRASLLWTPPAAPYHIELSADNLFDTKYETGAFYVGDATALIWGRPRWLSLRVFTSW